MKKRMEHSMLLMQIRNVTNGARWGTLREVVLKVKMRVNSMVETMMPTHADKKEDGNGDKRNKRFFIPMLKVKVSAQIVKGRFDYDSGKKGGGGCMYVFLSSFPDVW